MPDANNDQVLVNEIKRAIEQLNNAIDRARKEGLWVRHDSGNTFFEVIEFDKLNIYRKYK